MRNLVLYYYKSYIRSNDLYIKSPYFNNLYVIYYKKTHLLFLTFYHDYLSLQNYIIVSLFAIIIVDFFILCPYYQFEAAWFVCGGCLELVALRFQQIHIGTCLVINKV